MPKLNSSPSPETIIWLHAPAGAGKTRLAATLSKFYKERPVAERKELISLTDLMWILFDRDGLLSLHAQGLDPYYYDLSAQPLSVPQFLESLKKRLDELPKQMQDLGCEWLVIDAISTFQHYVDTYFVASNARDAKPNAQRAYGVSQAVFREVMGRFKALPCKQLWLCHSRSGYISEMDAQQAVKEAASSATKTKEYKIVPDVTPANFKWLSGVPSVTIGIEVDDANRRSIVAGEGTDTYIKNRLADLMATRSKPDLRKFAEQFERLRDELTNNVKPHQQAK